MKLYFWCLFVCLFVCMFIFFLLSLLKIVSIFVTRLVLQPFLFSDRVMGDPWLKKF